MGPAAAGRSAFALVLTRGRVRQAKRFYDRFTRRRLGFIFLYQPYETHTGPACVTLTRNIAEDRSLARSRRSKPPGHWSPVRPASFSPFDHKLYCEIVLVHPHISSFASDSI
ncbi:Hypothetical protein NTJ_14724 [Nesidiocoris tenuis]|uniref:Uncharacterized protein n=1 Tax=Nesidiocoris tenuis TaxID=355587 RepID=A0ABN7BBZ9_9HEMI|nr:Hypothetical protein NTJ_14724 [Nesidiocoris tenuis]